MALNYHCPVIDPLVTPRGKPVPNSNALQWKSNRLYLPILLISLPIQSGFAIFRNWTMSLAQDFDTLLARQIHAGQKSKAKAIYCGSASSISNVGSGSQYLPAMQPADQVCVKWMKLWSGSKILFLTLGRSQKLFSLQPILNWCNITICWSGSSISLSRSQMDVISFASLKVFLSRKIAAHGSQVEYNIAMHRWAIQYLVSADRDHQ